jgi:hypothetical protein
VDNIGTISNTMHDLHDDVRDDPDDEDFTPDDAYDAFDEDGYEELAWPADRRWRPAVAVVGGVLAIGAVATAVILNSGDSATTKATIGPPVPRTVISTSAAPSPPALAPSMPTLPSASRTPQLPPETVTTLPPPSTLPLPSLGPARTPSALPPQAVPTPPALNPRTVVYTVTGTKQLIDLVNIVYTDARGFPVTELNVSLPWTKAVVLNPGVQTQSVIASSIYSHLNCAIVNAAGQPVVVRANNSAMTTCTR